MIKLIEYEPWHLEYLAPLVDKSWDPVDVQLFSQAYKWRGWAWTATTDDRRIIGAGGILHLWKGVGEVWSSLTPEIREHAFFLHRVTLRTIQTWFVKGGFHRLQSTVKKGLEPNETWLKRLGFEYEATLKEFGSDRADHNLYVWREKCRKQQ